MLLVIGAIIVSMAVAMMFFMEYRPVVLETDEGQQLTIGPVRYTLTYEGIKDGLEEINSNRTFMKVGIVAENLQGEPVVTEKRQFTLLDKKNNQTKPTHGEFAGESKIIAYFALDGDELDEEFEYRIMVRPTKEQASLDIGFVCMANCR